MELGTAVTKACTWITPRQAFTSKIDPTAKDKAAFAGLFWGEGCVSWSDQRVGVHRKHLMLTLALRSDDWELIQWICDRFGGGAVGYYKPVASSSMARWRVRARSDVAKVLEMLAESTLPSKKLREVRLALDAIALLNSGVSTLDPRIERIVFEMSRLKKYDKDKSGAAVK